MGGMRFFRRVFLPGIVSAVALLGCKADEGTSQPGGLGIDGASGNVMANDMAPVDGRDVDLVTRRGVLLGWEEYLFAVGLEAGMGRAGGSAYAGLLPVAAVDEGFNSGQITVYRWMNSDVGEDGALEAKRAHKWLVIPMLLRPDRLLENELFDFKVDEGSGVERQLDAIILATKTAVAAYPDGRWNPHGFLEDGQDEKFKDRKQTRVYLMATKAGTPDLEVLVADAKKKKPPEVVHMLVHHRDGLATPIVSELEHPGAMSVARVISMRKIGERVPVSAAGGERWTVNSETGELVHGGADQ